MKKNLLFLLLMAPVCLWGQTVNVNTVSELRQLADHTEVMYQVESSDTVYATTDGQLCLSDGKKILAEGLEGAKGGMTLTGVLCGTKKSANGYPLLQIDVQKSNYSLYGVELSWYVFDLDEYEKTLSGNGGQEEEEKLPQDDVQGIPTVESIKAFKRLKVGTEARLQLHNDTILFIGGNDAYLRGDAAICLRGTGLSFEVGMVLRGTLIGIKGEQDGLPLLLPSANTSDKYYVSDMVSFIKDRYFDFSDLAAEEEEIGNVVTIEDVVVDSLSDNNGTRRLYVTKGTVRLPVVDYYSFCNRPLTVPAHCASMKAVLSAGSNTLQLYPVASLDGLLVPSGICSVKSANTSVSLFDLQGRRLNGVPTRGLYIKDGKKHVVR